MTAAPTLPFDGGGGGASDVVNITSLTVDQFMLLHYGPKRDHLYIVVPLIAIYVVILITGLIGNVSTCVVIAKNRSMHTATNYYLFSLAISDLLLLVSGLPPEIYSNWSRYPYVFGQYFCVMRGLFAETSANATVLTITAFTVERYVAICHPFLSHTTSKLSRVIKVIIAIWLVSIGLAIPQAMQFDTVALIEGNEESVVCQFVNPLMRYSFEISTILFFVFPMCVISVLYMLIGLQLRSSADMIRRPGDSVSGATRGNNSSRNGHGQSTKRVVKMLVAVVVAFFICWAPFHTQRLVAIYVLTDDDQFNKYLKVYEVVTYISGVLYFVSTSINPLLYNIMSNKFREAFKETFARICCRWRCCGLCFCCCCCQPVVGGGRGTAVGAADGRRAYSVLSRAAHGAASSGDSSCYYYYSTTREDDQTRSSLTHRDSSDSVHLQMTGRRSCNDYTRKEIHPHKFRSLTPVGLLVDANNPSATNSSIKRTKRGKKKFFRSINISDPATNFLPVTLRNDANEILHPVVIDASRRSVNLNLVLPSNDDDDDTCGSFNGEDELTSYMKEIRERISGI